MYPTFEYSPEVESAVGVPGTHVLGAAYPNPFNPVARFTLAVGHTQHVRVAVYNMLGQRVATLADRYYQRGTYVVPFDATGLPSGVYYYRLETDGFISPKAMILAK